MHLSDARNGLLRQLRCSNEEGTAVAVFGRGGETRGLGQTAGNRDAVSAGPGISVFSCAPPASILRLTSGDVHVWQFRKTLVVGELCAFESLLAQDELERARRFHRTCDRETSIAARGLLRRLVGSYLGVAPGEVRFQYSKTGKPELHGHVVPGELQFSVAHSADVIVIACGRRRRVGVDVEEIHPDSAMGAIAEKFFRSAERAALDCLPPAEQVRASYRCWTRKEAYLKATGAGLSALPDVPDVSIGGEGTFDLIHDEQQNGEAACWLLQNLELQPGYAAALAAEC